MLALLFSLLDGYGRFQRWFDSRYGWFFTNGMKVGRTRGMHPVKA